MTDEALADIIYSPIADGLARDLGVTFDRCEFLPPSRDGIVCCDLHFMHPKHGLLYVYFEISSILLRNAPCWSLVRNNIRECLEETLSRRAAA